MDSQTLPKCIRLYGGQNISRLKFSLITPKTAKSANISPSEYLGYTVLFSTLAFKPVLLTFLLCSAHYTPESLGSPDSMRSTSAINLVALQKEA